MKRDFDLIRRMLLDAEAADKMLYFTSREELHQLAIMKDAGLVEGNVVKGASGQPVKGTLSRLTWAGSDFLDAARSDSVWKTAQEKVLKPGASITFGILLEWLKHEAQKRLGIDLGA